jgi:hypothetical protein
VPAKVFLFLHSSAAAPTSTQHHRRPPSQGAGDPHRSAFENGFTLLPPVLAAYQWTAGSPSQVVRQLRPILGLDLLRPPGISQNQRRQNRHYDSLSSALDVRTQLVIRIAGLEPQIRYLHRPAAAKYAH